MGVGFEDNRISGSGAAAPVLPRNAPSFYSLFSAVRALADGRLPSKDLFMTHARIVGYLTQRHTDTFFARYPAPIQGPARPTKRRRRFAEHPRDRNGPSVKLR